VVRGRNIEVTFVCELNTSVPSCARVISLYYFFIAEVEIHNTCCIQSNFKDVEQWDFYQFPYEDILQSNRSHCVRTPFLLPTFFFSKFIPSLVKIFTDLFIMRITVPRINFSVLLLTKTKRFYLCNREFHSY